MGPRSLEARILRALDGKTLSFEDLLVKTIKFDDDDVLRALMKLIEAGHVSVSRGLRNGRQSDHE